MIVATAGHIDHGKTLLVKALTGTDTDRLPEEKARGISIDLGFAYLPLADGRHISFVDVPGHQRFIRNMLVGVSEVDYAMLVVAADDGVMPQTIEHLHILCQLDVQKGAIVINKVDRVTEARVVEVEKQVRDLIASVGWQSFTLVRASAKEGTGIAVLQQLLIAEAEALQPRPAEGENFRFSVDRTFSVSGIGTIVTGTVCGGAVNINDRALISPSGKQTRIRGIQINRAFATRASVGQRCALNLSGVSVEEVARGDWVVAPAIAHSTTRMDVRVSVLNLEPKAIMHWTPVHLHIASAEVTGRLSIRRGGEIPPGGSQHAQIILDRAISAWNGDRFILRDQSSTRTIGGGVVLDPQAEPWSRRDTLREARLAALEQPSQEEALESLLKACLDGVDLHRFEKTFNLTPERAASIYRGLQMHVVGRQQRTGLETQRHHELLRGIVEGIAQFHFIQPQQSGVPAERVRRRVCPGLPDDPYQALVRELADAAQIVAEGGMLRLPNYRAAESHDDMQMWPCVERALMAAHFMPLTVRHLAAELKIPQDKLEDLLVRKAASGEVVRVASDRFYLRATLSELAGIARKTARSSNKGLFTAAEYRDATGASRRAVIKVLEFFDTYGVTFRVGDSRRMGRDFIPLFGAPRGAAQLGDDCPQAGSMHG